MILQLRDALSQTLQIGSLLAYNLIQQMLFGRIIRQGTPFAFNQELQKTEKVSPVLLLSNVALGLQNKNQTSLWVKKEEQQFLIVTLSAERQHASLSVHLFIEQEAQLFVKGPGSIHVIGAFDKPLEPLGGIGGMMGGLASILRGMSGVQDDGEDEQEGGEEQASPKKTGIAIEKPQQSFKRGETVEKKSQAIKPASQPYAISQEAKRAFVEPSSRLPNPATKVQALPAIDDKDEISDQYNEPDDESIDQDQDHGPSKQRRLDGETKQWLPHGTGPSQQQQNRPFHPNQNAGGFHDGNQGGNRSYSNKHFNRGGNWSGSHGSHKNNFNRGGFHGGRGGSNKRGRKHSNRNRR